MCFYCIILFEIFLNRKNFFRELYLSSHEIQYFSKNFTFGKHSYVTHFMSQNIDDYQIIEDMISFEIQGYYKLLRNILNESILTSQNHFYNEYVVMKIQKLL